MSEKEVLFAKKLILGVVISLLLVTVVQAASWHSGRTQTCNTDQTQFYRYPHDDIWGDRNYLSTKMQEIFTGTSSPLTLKDKYNPLTNVLPYCVSGDAANQQSTGYYLSCDDDCAGLYYTFLFVESPVEFFADFLYNNEGIIRFYYYDELTQTFTRETAEDTGLIGSSSGGGQKHISLTKSGWYLMQTIIGEDTGDTSNWAVLNNFYTNVGESPGVATTYENLGIHADKRFLVGSPLYDMDDYPDYCDQYGHASAQKLGIAIPNELAERRCCGDDPEDEGFIYGNYKCENNAWKEYLSGGAYCKEVVGATTETDVYLSDSGTSAEDIINLFSGDDGCCGDDSVLYDECSGTIAYGSCAAITDPDLCTDAGCTSSITTNFGFSTSCQDLTMRDCTLQQGCHIKNVINEWHCAGTTSMTCDDFFDPVWNSCDDPLSYCTLNGNSCTGPLPLSPDRPLNSIQCQEYGYAWVPVVCDGTPDFCADSPSNIGCSITCSDPAPETPPTLSCDALSVKAACSAASCTWDDGANVNPNPSLTDSYFGDLANPGTPGTTEMPEGYVFYPLGTDGVNDFCPGAFACYAGGKITIWPNPYDPTRLNPSLVAESKNPINILNDGSFSFTNLDYILKVDVSENTLTTDETVTISVCFNQPPSIDSWTCLDTLDVSKDSPKEYSLPFTLPIGNPWFLPGQQMKIKVEASGLNQNTDEHLTINSIGIIPKLAGDQGYVSNNEFLCADDLNTVRPNSIEYSSPEDAENFWWSTSYENSFLTHKVDAYDYLSNTEKWYVCDVRGQDDTSSLTATKISALTTLPKPQVTGGDANICPSTPSDFDLVTEVPDVTFSNYAFTPACTNAALNSASGLDANFFSDYLEVNSDLKAALTTYNADNGHDYDYYFKGCCNTQTSLDPTLGLSLIQYTAAVSQCADACYDKEGNPTDTFVVNQNPPSNLDPADPNFNGYGGLTGTQALSCADLSLRYYIVNDLCETGELCKPNPGAFYGYIVGSSEGNDAAGNPIIGNCCLDGMCVPQGSETCSSLAGQHPYITYELNPDPDEIAGSGKVICDTDELTETDVSGLSSGEACCIGSWHKVFADEEIIPVADSQSFMCYPGWDDKSVFGECCGTTNCASSDIITQSGSLVDQGNAFGVGGELHTLISFDQNLPIQDSSNYYGIGKYWLNFDMSNYIANDDTTVNIDRTATNYLAIQSFQQDLSEYDRLSFDIFWTGPFIPEGFGFEYKEGDAYSKHLVTDDISQYAIVKELPRSLWNRVTIPFNTATQTFLATHKVTNIYFTFDKDTRSNADDGNFILDNVVVHSNDNNFDSRWCSGKYKTWINNLNPPADATAAEKEEYAQACNWQMSYEWTGNHCCGSLSTSADSTNRLLGEYYTDDFGGCWGGVRVGDDQTVSGAFRTLTHEPYVLYKNDEFHSCDYPIDPFCDVIDGAGCTDADKLHVTDHQPYDIVGGWYCDPGSPDTPDDNFWQDISYLNRRRILMAKLYGLADTSETFVVHCDEPVDHAINNPEPTVADKTVDFSQVDTVCVLSISDDNTDETTKVVTGVVLEPSIPIDVFINSNLRAYYPHNEEETDLLDCGVDDPNFFVRCDARSSTIVEPELTKGQYLDVYYNKPLNILYFSNEDLDANQGFFTNLWSAIVSFFQNLFGSSPDTSSSLPQLELDFNIESEFSHAFIAHTNGGREIVASLEKLSTQDASCNDNEITCHRQARIDFTNFVSDVSALQDIILAQPESMTNPLLPRDVRYCASGKTQTIFVDLTALKEFDWRYLTSNLHLDDSVTGPPFEALSDPTCLLHNGHIDGTEFCDDTLSEYRTIVALASGQTRFCPDGTTPKLCVNGELDNSPCTSSDYVLFATSADYTGNLDGVLGADTICQQAALEINPSHADFAFAIISDSNIDANSRARPDSAIYENNLDRSYLGSYGDLMNRFTSTSNFIYDEFGNPLSNLGNGEIVWTGSKVDGSKSASKHCTDWTSALGIGDYGDTDNFLTSGAWLHDTATNSRLCGIRKRIYCLVEKPQP